MTEASEAFTIIWPESARFVQQFAPRCPECNRPVRGRVVCIGGHLYHEAHAPKKTPIIPMLEDERDAAENAQREEQEAAWERHMAQREC